MDGTNIAFFQKSHQNKAVMLHSFPLICILNSAAYYLQCACRAELTIPPSQPFSPSRSKKLG